MCTLQDKYNNATRQLSPMLKTLGRSKTLKELKKDTPWRMDPKLFRPSETGDIEHGCLNYSPSWFAQGHEVRILSTSY